MSEVNPALRTIRLTVEFSLPKSHEETLQKGQAVGFIMEHFFLLPTEAGLLEKDFSATFLWNREEGLLFAFHHLPSEDQECHKHLHSFESIINLDKHGNLEKFLQLRQMTRRGDYDNLFANEDLAPIVDSDLSIFGISGRLLLAEIVRFVFFHGGMLWILEEDDSPRRKRVQPVFGVGELEKAV